MIFTAIAASSALAVAAWGLIYWGLLKPVNNFSSSKGGDQLGEQSARPTATGRPMATAAPAGVVKKVSDLPISFGTSADGNLIDYFNSVAQNDDSLGFTLDAVGKAGGIDAFKAAAARVTRGKVTYNYPSWQTAESEAGKLRGAIDGITYDLEKWDKSRGESADIAQASQQMERVARENGFYYVAGLSRQLVKNTQNVTAMAKYSDVYNIHDHSYFKTRDWAGYVKFIHSQAALAKADNPDVIIEILVSTNQPGYTAGDIFNQVIVPSLDAADRVTIYSFGGGKKAIQMMKDLVALMRP